MHNSGTLQHLVRVTAWILRWPRDCSKLQTKDRTSINSRRGQSWIGGGPPGSGSKSKEITASEYQDALRILIYFDQKRRLALKKSSQLVTKKVKMKLTNLNLEFEIRILHGRVKNFPIGFGPNEEIPVLPCGRLAELIVRHHHHKLHRDIDTVVSVVRDEF